MCEPVSQKYSEELYDVPERLQRKHCTSVCVYTRGITLGKTVCGSSKSYGWYQRATHSSVGVKVR